MQDFPERNIKLLVEYDGGPYTGWQLQQGSDTIQGRLMAAINKVTGAVPNLRVAGRTDAGVHALGQVASFRTRCPINIRRLPLALNACLPTSISVHYASEMSTDFDARHDSVSKRYCYRTLLSHTASPLWLGRSWHVRGERLKLNDIRIAATHLIGEHDFESFRSVHCDAAHARRKMFSIDVISVPHRPRGEIVEITFHANAYCRHMCRILAGTLVEVGLGKRSPADVKDILAARDRKGAGVTAPACGLTLLEVFY